MESYRFLFDVALILLSTKLFGLLTKRFQMPQVVGALLAGLLLGPAVLGILTGTAFIQSSAEIGVIVLMFCAGIGLQVKLPQMTSTVILFSAILVVVAILTKVVGCGLGAKMCRYKNYQSLRIGIGMISRGEVALIVASKGTALGLLGSNFLGPVILTVIITTIITPILLKIVFKRGGPNSQLPEPSEGDFAAAYEELSRYRSEPDPEDSLPSS